MLKNVALSAIEFDTDFQPRAAIDLSAVEEYAEIMREAAGFGQFPPVDLVLGQDGYQSKFWPWDGWHRLLAARQAGLSIVPANVKSGSREDALWLSLSANQTHGLRRSQADKRRAVESALVRFSGKSDREIARHVGVSHPTVDAVRAELVLTGKISSQNERTGADGRTINTTNIGGQLACYRCGGPVQVRPDGRLFCGPCQTNWQNRAVFEYQRGTEARLGAAVENRGRVERRVILDDGTLFEAAESTRSADSLIDNKIRGIITIEGKTYTSTGGVYGPGQSQLDMVEVVPLDAWPGETKLYADNKEGHFSYVGQRATYRGREFVLTGNELTIKITAANLKALENSEASNAPVWQLEQRVREWLNRSESAQGRNPHDILLDIKSRTDSGQYLFKMLASSITDRHRPGDLWQAVNNVAEQLRVAGAKSAAVASDPLDETPITVEQLEASIALYLEKTRTPPAQLAWLKQALGDNTSAAEWALRGFLTGPQMPAGSYTEADVIEACRNLLAARTGEPRYRYTIQRDDEATPGNVVAYDSQDGLTLSLPRDDSRIAGSGEPGGRPRPIDEPCYFCGSQVMLLKDFDTRCTACNATWGSYNAFLWARQRFTSDPAEVTPVEEPAVDTALDSDSPPSNPVAGTFDFSTITTNQIRQHLADLARDNLPTDSPYAVRVKAELARREAAGEGAETLAQRELRQLIPERLARIMERIPAEYLGALHDLLGEAEQQFLGGASR